MSVFLKKKMDSVDERKRKKDKRGRGGEEIRLQTIV